MPDLSYASPKSLGRLRAATGSQAAGNIGLFPGCCMSSCPVAAAVSADAFMEDHWSCRVEGVLETSAKSFLFWPIFLRAFLWARVHLPARWSALSLFLFSWLFSNPKPGNST
ncbi:hypothetical protein CGRA01v4_11271 [Colletotrichum graminicola]|nr:hypothetical protein CGRA01v4_11271 [Colletotrichum graminicola]